MNIGQDPAYRPVLKIPLNGEKLTKIPGNCAKVRMKHNFNCFKNNIDIFRISNLKLDY